MKTLPELSVDYSLRSAEAFAEALAAAEAITAAYRSHYYAESAPELAQREAAVLAVQYAAMFQSVEAGDAFAGRVYYPLIGLSPEAMGLGYYCAYDALLSGAERYGEHGMRARVLAANWRGKTTQEQCRQGYPDWLAERLPSDNWTEDSGVAFPLYRLAGSVLDYSKLLRIGLDGLDAELAATPFAHVVPLLRATLERYHAEITCPEMRRTLAAIRHAPPQTFRQAIQLFWLYALHAGTWNYGRLDDALGPFLDADLQAGTLREDEALDLLCSLWRLMHAYSNQYNNRVIIGGQGRTNPEAADRFGLLAIAATRRLRLNQPQLSLRLDAAQNPQLWERAVDAIGEGCTFPMLYNDAVNVPAVAAAFDLPEHIAQQYTPYGCGEYVLGHYSEGSPNGVINLLKALEVVLHGGVDPLTGNTVVAGLPAPEELDSFEVLWSAYERVVAYYVEALAVLQKLEYESVAEQAPFGFISALTADCVARGKSAFGGGACYLGGTIETYGNTNAADSLHVIETLVFREKTCTLPELVAALDANFEGHAGLRAACRQVSKYGNDEGTADAMAQRVHAQVCHCARRQAASCGLDYYLVVIINNWANTLFGWTTAASAEGRLAGQPLANGNNPASGSDTQGISAFLNSLTRLDPKLHAGAVQNMKFGREWFTPELRPKFSALLRAYFAQGGTQAMITVLNRADLEAAMQEPEKWSHLLVRVGGFSIRFIDLPLDAQREVLSRTLHEA